MKRLGTIGILAAAGLAAASLALLPSSADIDRDQPGISVGETPADSDNPGSGANPEGGSPEDGDGAEQGEGPAGFDPAEEAARKAAGKSSGAAVDATRVQKPASRPRGGTDSGSNSRGGGGSGSGSGSGRGVCEWDDDGWECDGGGDDDGDDD